MALPVLERPLTRTLAGVTRPQMEEIMATTGIAAIEKTSEMQTAINENSGAVNALGQRVDALAKKLEPVLRATPASTTPVAPGAPLSSVPVILQIENETGKVHGIVELIEDLLGRLPL